MKKIVFKDKFAFLYLLKEIYSKDSILSSAREYKDFFNISVTEIGKYNVVKIERIDKEYSLETLVREFMNYIISEEFTRKKINSP